jgi:putative addiction module killer protein
MVEVLKSATFDVWLSGLRDRQAGARIKARITRLSLGNPGDVKSVARGISEMRIDYGPGYRVYFMQQQRFIVVLLCGGDKRTQDADIKRAIKIAKDWK